jgi:hypothetical protein
MLKRGAAAPFLRRVVPPSREVDMLPPFIIEEIRRREAERKRADDRPRLELPLDQPRPVVVSDERERERESERPGFVIIDVL